eukprot:4633229-Alexandrium_andersonii.AAC.1
MKRGGMAGRRQPLSRPSRGGPTTFARLPGPMRGSAPSSYRLLPWRSSAALPSTCRRLLAPGH